MAANPLWDLNEYQTRYVKDPQIEEWIRQGIIRRNDRGDWDIDFERLPTVAGTNYHINEDLGNGILIPAGGGETKDPGAVYHDPYYGDMTSSANINYPLSGIDIWGPLAVAAFAGAGAAGLLPTFGGEAAAGAGAAAGGGGGGLLGSAGGVTGTISELSTAELASMGFTGSEIAALGAPAGAGGGYTLAQLGTLAPGAAGALTLPAGDPFDIPPLAPGETATLGGTVASKLPSVKDILSGLGAAASTAASSGLLGGTPEGGGGAPGGGGGGLGGGSAGTSYMELLRRRYGLA